MLRVPFIDRKRELKALEGLKGLGIVYGRRRVGKTRLLLEWLRGKKGVFWEAFVGSWEELSKSFAKTVKRELEISVAHDLLEALEELEEVGVPIVIDEFQYVVQADPSVTSKLKLLIDRGMEYPLVLSGSAVSFIERELLGHSSPLFGRRSLQLKIKPLPFYYAKEFWDMDWEESLKAYAMIGGTPAYLAQTYSSRSLKDLISKAFSYGSPLLEEGDLIFHEESFRRPEVYKRILRALATGYKSPSKLASKCSLDARSIYYYLEMLEELDIIRYVLPLGRRKGGIVEFVDEYFRFYYSTLVELKGAIEAGINVIDDIEKRVEELISETFERVTEQSLPLLYQLGLIKTKPLKVGKWWHKGEEIDLVVQDDVSTTFIEVKWSELDEEDERRILEELKEKARKSGLMKDSNYFVIVCKRCKGGIELLNALKVAKDKGLEL
ncbi:hypothetical protein IPA_07900 [Ignicoccus pacificus DSM 13166]|uniref:ATP-binding protein n=1 Tax=Ignicoccus pacificus DSM 13166 TaxID=940294 RepID=A0A977KBV2_9CREN|nr:hypothetical protein IPA_07900 [Ignicoccus pacificus DSM 13166]